MSSTASTLSERYGCGGPGQDRAGTHLQHASLVPVRHFFPRRWRAARIGGDLHSATAYAEAERQRLGDRPGPYPAPFNFIRKMACSFGWDWGPDLRTAGLWKPVRLERWSVARIAQVVPLVTLDDRGTGRVELRIELERLDSEAPLTLTADILGQRVESAVDQGSAAATLVIDVPEAPVWWPVGYGEQPLAELTLMLSTGDHELDRWQRRLGFRSVELDTSTDDIGTAFTISVNRRPVFVKGVNWIPDDHFLTRITAERIDTSARPGRGRECQSDSRLGRWHLRERRLLSGMR